MNDPRESARGDVRVRELITPYLRGRVRRGEIIALTARNHRTALDQFAEVCGNRPVSHISRREVERWMERPIAASTKRWRLSVISGFCTWLVEERHLGANPCANVRRPKEPRRLPRALRGAQVAAVLRSCPDARARLLVMLMVQQGLRRGEVARLQLGDIDLADGSMRIIGKGGHERILPIAAECLDAIDAYLSEYPAALGPLVRSYQFPRALHPDTVSAIVRTAMQEAGVKKAPLDRVSPHSLRHTMATDTLRAGAHLRDVQHLLGHKHLQTTETYLPLVVNDLRAAISGRRYRHAET